MIAHPNEPAITAAASTLFGASSPWVPFTSERASFTREQILEIDLWKVSAFKQHAVAELADKKKIGTVRVKSESSIEVKTAGFTSSQNAYPPDPRLRAGQTFDLRMCDEYAATIATRSGYKGPAFRVFWPQPQRDRALVEMIAWLKTR